MKRHYLSMLFTTLLILCNIVVKAQEFEANGIRYKITDATNKTVEVIKGNYSGSLKIPATVAYSGKSYNVTAIGNNGFNSCDMITEIEIPNSVTTIGNYSFVMCTRLKSIIIPNIVTEIGEYAFYGCSELEYINLPENITKINGYTFYNCSKLTTIKIPKNVVKIGNNAFSGCTNLKDVIIPGSVTAIESNAFSKCYNITSVTSLIPAEKIFEIGTNVFTSTSYTSSSLYVPYGAKDVYLNTSGWNSFNNIIELEGEVETVTEVTISINQYGSATYCSQYALDFSNVAGLKAYTATGYNTGTQVVTLTRIQTSKEGTGLFLVAEPGEYIVPVIEASEDYSLNMLVGTLRNTSVSSKSNDGYYFNFKYTVIGENHPSFYPFEDGSILSANKAYLQLPASLFPATASKSVSVRLDDGTTTEIYEMNDKGTDSKTIYDMQGRIVENVIKGIYIIDGKKVVK